MSLKLINCILRPTPPMINSWSFNNRVWSAFGMIFKPVVKTKGAEAVNVAVVLFDEYITLPT